jgi:hypothetical protein
MDLGTSTIRDNVINQTGGILTLKEDNVDGTVGLVVENGATVDVASYHITVGDATFNSGSALALQVNTVDDKGTFAAQNMNVMDGAILKATLGQDLVKVGESKRIQLLTAGTPDFNNFSDEFDNNMFKFVKDGKNGAYIVSLVKSGADVSRENGGTETNIDAAAAWIDGDGCTNPISKAVADGLIYLAQTDGKAMNAALTALAPNDAPILQETIVERDNHLFLGVSDRLRNDNLEKVRGLSSGDFAEDVSVSTAGTGRSAGQPV